MAGARILPTLRGLALVILAYGMMVFMALYYLPRTALNSRYALRACKAWCAATLWLARNVAGITVSYRGEVPDEPCLIVSKHQSFLDIIALVHVLPAPRFVMKKSLLYTPIVGYFAKAIGCVAVDRGKGAVAMQQMLSGVAGDQHGQIIIYPQGTRVPPGEKRPYKVGAAVLYTALQRDVVPVAVNVGRFWPRKGVIRNPGQAVVEFLPIYKAGRDQDRFLADMETVIESASDALDASATGVPTFE